MKRKLFITALLLATTLTACVQTTQVPENTQISEQTENQTIEEADTIVDNENEVTEIEGFETTEEIKTREYINPYTEEIKELCVKVNDANTQYARYEDENGYLVKDKKYQGTKTSEIYNKDFETLFSKLFKDYTNNYYTMEISINNGVESYNDMQLWMKGKNTREYRKLAGEINDRYIVYIGGEYLDASVQPIENIDDYLETSEKLNDLWLETFEYLSDIEAVDKNNGTYLYYNSDLEYIVDDVEFPEELQEKLNDFNSSGTKENEIDNIRVYYTIDNDNDSIMIQLKSPHANINIRINGVEAVIE